VRSFDEAICTRVVAADSDESNVVSFCEIFEGGDEGGPLSVTISLRDPHRHMMSSKIQSPMVLAVSLHSMQNLG
jgi:hypothetical protein